MKINWISAIFNFGVTSDCSEEEAMTIRLTNKIALIMIVAATPYFFIFHHFHLTLAGNFVLLVLALYFMVFIFNRVQWVSASQMINILSQSIIILPFYTLHLGHSSGAHLMYVPLSILPFIIFNPTKQVRVKWLSNICIYASLILVTIIQHTRPELAISLSSEATQIIYYIAFITTFCLVIPQIVVFYQAELNAKDLLKSTNNQLNSTLIKLKESREAQALLTQHADYAKLVQSIAHEFKNPLQMLQGTAEIGLLKDKQNTELFETIIKSVKRLNNVIQPLLLYLNKKTSYVFESINIIKVVDEIITLSKANCKSKSIELTFEHDIDEIFIFADGQFIGQVIINLLTNAIQAISGAGGAIRILIEYDSFLVNKNMVQAIKLSIKDTGCGIPEEKINSIFMPYESNHSNEHNLGLGLSIVAKIIKDHHGQIKVHSDVGVGTAVAIWLPLSKSGESNAKDVDQMFELDDSFFET